MSAVRRELTASRWRELAVQLNADAAALRREGFPTDAAELEEVAVAYTAAAEELELGFAA